MISMVLVDSLHIQCMVELQDTKEICHQATMLVLLHQVMEEDHLATCLQLIISLANHLFMVQLDSLQFTAR